MKNKIFFSGLWVAAAILFFAFAPGEKHGCNRQVTNSKTETGIQFVDANWAKAIDAAKKQKKMIFIDAYTRSCGPCRM
mgnify:CR=1 FL=1